MTNGTFGAGVAVTAMTLSALVLPGCAERGEMTREGPPPTPSAFGADFDSQVARIFAQIFRQHLREDNHSDSVLIAAYSRAKEFEHRGRFFADDGYLPGGIRTWNHLAPSDAAAAIEELLRERGISCPPS